MNSPVLDVGAVLVAAVFIGLVSFALWWRFVDRDSDRPVKPLRRQ